MATGKHAWSGLSLGLALALAATLISAQPDAGVAASKGTRPLRPLIINGLAATLWRSPTEVRYFGALTDMTLAHLSITGPCARQTACYINNTLSVSAYYAPPQPHSGPCRGDSTCSIDAGYAVDPDINLGREYFFWREWTPSGMSFHFEGSVRPDDYDGVFHFIIVQVDPTVYPNTFVVAMYNDGFRTAYNGYSKGNPMAPDWIGLGLDVLGPTNASASTATFRQNFYAASPTQFDPYSITAGGFGVVPQTSVGAGVNFGGAVGQWLIVPPPAGQQPAGGVFATKCC